MRRMIVALSFAGVLAACQTPQPQTPPSVPDARNIRANIAYACENGATFTASFLVSPDAVDLNFANGDVIRLPHVVSGSGFRYADGGKHEFQGKADEATYTVGKMMPTKCTVAK